MVQEQSENTQARFLSAQESPDSRTRLDILDTMDELRALGLSHFIDLPQIIVCGDQSSGKSSVLEALSGINFPRSDSLCTRFATEVILRRNKDENTSVSIVPHQTRSQAEQQNLRAFSGSNNMKHDLSDTIERAKQAMGIDSTNKRFSNDILRVEITGPDQEHLTLVDLPGLFWAGTKTQSDEDAEAVKSLVLNYMRNKRSIILAVVSAKNDIANQIVTKYASQEDHDGSRTLGLLTKPDTLHEGSDSEQSFFELAENKNIFFRHGWHVMVNRDFNTRDDTLEERNLAEQEFLSRGIWSVLAQRQKGVDALKPRLSSLLYEQIIIELPGLLRDVEQQRSKSKSILQKMGDARGHLQAQRSYLLHASQRFTELLKASVDGVYNDEFFGDPCTDEGEAKRLRAVTQNLSMEFARVMREKGHAKHIVDGPVSKQQKENDNRLLSRDDYVDHILDVMRRTRGRELPGTYSPLIVGDLFRAQCVPWVDIVHQHCQKVWEATMHALNLILDNCADSETVRKVKSDLIGPQASALKTRLGNEAEDLLRPHRSGHPITYNHYFTDNLHKIRTKHIREQFMRKVNEVLGTTDVASATSKIKLRGMDAQELIDGFSDATIADMDRYACSELADASRAYYKVALKTVVDEMSTLCVERRLLIPVLSVFTPHTVMTMSDALVEKIAAESPESAQERESEMRKSKLLEKAFHMLQQLYGQEFDRIKGDSDEGFSKPKLRSSVVSSHSRLASSVGSPSASSEKDEAETETVEPEALEAELTVPAALEEEFPAPAALEWYSAKKHRRDKKLKQGGWESVSGVIRERSEYME